MDEADALWREHFRARLAAGERPTFVAEGHSMWPTIRAGTTVRIEPLESTPAVGAVILAAWRGRRILHRVIGTRPGAVLLKGDANPRDDGWCDLDWVVGRVARKPGDCVRARVARHVGPRAAWFIGLCRTRLARRT